MPKVSDEEAMEIQSRIEEIGKDLPPANSYMHGGNHYRLVEGEQHWDRMYRLFGPGYFIGSITKYVERYQHKNGVEDLKKAMHFIQKLIELETEKATKESDNSIDRDVESPAQRIGIE